MTPGAGREVGRSVHTGFAQRIVFGPRAIEDVAGLVKEIGARRVLLITTRGRRESEAGERLVRGLGRTLADVFDGAATGVPAPAVQAAVGAARGADVDGVVSFGGGACADLAKAVCFFLEREAGTPGVSFVDRPAIGHVSVPTTYAGAELTPQFWMTDPAARRPTGAASPTTAPLAAVYDPIATIELPVRISAETGMAALAHGVEVACSPDRTPEAEVLALACVREVAAAVADVVDDPYDIDARTRLLRAAMLGARALQNGTVGAAHGLAHLLAARVPDVSYGLAHALLLGPVLRYTAEEAPAEAARIGHALGDVDDPPGAIDRLRERLGLPAQLAECGVKLDDLDSVARLSGGNPEVAANARPMTEDDARAVLAAAY